MTHPFYKIHHVNKRFNALFDAPLYYIAGLVVFVNVLLPYSFRIGFAFLINIFFNRPLVYANFFAEKIGKKANGAMLALFYFTIIGAYACVFKAISYLHKKNSDTNWMIAKEEEDYFHQS